MSKNAPTSENGRRIKGDGSLYFNEARQVWVAQCNEFDPETGKRVRKSASGQTKSEALAKMRAIQSGKKQSDHPKRSAPKSKAGKQHDLYCFTLDYLNVFKKPTVTSRTFEWYLKISKHIRDGLDGMTLERLTATDIQKFLNTLAPEKSSSTLRYVNILLKQVLKHAVKQKILDSNPMEDGVKCPKSGKPQQKNKALPRHICRDILNAVEHSPTYKPLIMVLLYTGIRVGELMALRWSNIDWENMLLHIENAATVQYEFDDEGNTISSKVVVSDTKTAASQRVIPLEPELLDVLDTWRENSKKLQAKAQAQGNADYIFPNKSGGLRSYQGFKAQFKRFLEENGLGDSGITFHKFRHTFATLLMEQDTNPRVVQELLGHRDIETTLGIYTSVSVGVMVRETNKLASELASIRNMTGTDQRHKLIVTHTQR